MIQKAPINVLIAEDDADDRQMIREAFEEANLNTLIQFANDGEVLMNLLLDLKEKSGQFIKLPELILLDLNMPKKDGREVLVEIKSDPVLKRIPVVILTTSKAQEDILRAYDLGVNGFISKPVSFVELVQTIRVLGNYWFDIAKLPSASENTITL